MTPFKKKYIKKIIILFHEKNGGAAIRCNTKHTQDEQDENVSFRLLTANRRQTTAAKLPVPKGLAAFVNRCEGKVINWKEQMLLGLIVVCVNQPALEEVAVHYAGTTVETMGASIKS